MPFLNDVERLQQVTPSRVSRPSYDTSTSSSVLNRREVILKNRRRNLSFGPGTCFDIHLENNNAFWDMENSYWRGELTVDTTAISNADVCLEENGLHALFSEWRITLASTGQILNQEKHYNETTALVQKLHYDKDELRHVHQYDLRGHGFEKGELSGGVDFDEIKIDGYTYNTGNVVRIGNPSDANALVSIDGGNTYSSAVFAVNYNPGTDLTTIELVEDINAATVAPGQFMVVIGRNGALVEDITFYEIISGDDGADEIDVKGDLSSLNISHIIISETNNLNQSGFNILWKPWQQVIVDNTFVGYVKKVSGQYIILQENTSQLALAAEGELGSNQRLIITGSSGYTNSRYFERGKTVTIPFLFRPELGMLKCDGLFPLFLLGKGINMEGYIDRDAIRKAFVWLPLPDVETVDKGLTFSITNLEYVMVLYQMNPIINQQYTSMYEGVGIKLPYIEYDVQETILSGIKSTTSCELRSKFRSVHHILGKIIPFDMVKGGTTLSYIGNMLSFFPRLGLTKYFLKYANTQIPECPLDLSKTQENLLRLKALYRHYRSTDSIHDRVNPLRIKPCDLDSRKFTRFDLGGPDQTGDQDNSILNVILARDDQGYFAGMDMQLDNLYLHLEYDSSLDAAWGKSERLLQTFIAHDTFLTIASQGTRRLT